MMTVQLSDIPRVRLAHLPTPLELLPRLSQRLGGPQIYVKRDDCTGLALGGNKVRKLEYLLADAVAQGADNGCCPLSPGATMARPRRKYPTNPRARQRSGTVADRNIRG